MFNELKLIFCRYYIMKNLETQKYIPSKAEIKMFDDNTIDKIKIKCVPSNFYVTHIKPFVIEHLSTIIVVAVIVIFLLYRYIVYGRENSNNVDIDNLLQSRNSDDDQNSSSEIEETIYPTLSDIISSNIYETHNKQNNNNYDI